jgi:hypothetical protein
MDSTAWVVNGLIPMVIALSACWLAGRLSAGSGTAPSSELPILREPAARRTCCSVPWPSLLAPAVLGLGWSLAVLAGLIGWRIAGDVESSFLWPEDFWQRGYLSLFAAALLLGMTTWSPAHHAPARWVAAGLLAMATASLSLPSGSGWEDALPAHQGWGLMLGGSCLLGFWAVDQLAARDADRWLPLVVLAMLAGPMFVAATTYGALAQWTLAAIAATLPCILFAAAGRLRHGVVVGFAYPGVAFATAMISAGRFFSYENHPWWTYLGMLLVAPAVALVDRGLPARKTWTRIIVAACVSTGLIAVAVARQLQATE